jgi:hypothetical protein
MSLLPTYQTDCDPCSERNASKGSWTKNFCERFGCMIGAKAQPRNTLLPVIQKRTCPFAREQPSDASWGSTTPKTLSLALTFEAASERTKHSYSVGLQ